ncbi:MAG: DNA photolyase family protein [Methylophilaceae bacterium]|nr:DNA photolyase family protein [Methylophilaceae bacterium]
MLEHESVLVWFRRDLRDYDHAALHHALRSARRVYCAFIFDTDILDRLPDKADRRVEFILACLQELQSALRARGGELIVRHGAAREEIPALAKELGVTAVFCNRDYEPSARSRDSQVAQALAHLGIAFRQYKDQVIFEEDEILTHTGKPYSIFTPYKNAWLGKLQPAHLQPFPTEPQGRLASPSRPCPLPELERLGFVRTNLSTLKLPAGMSGAATLLQDFLSRIDRYAEARDYPALKGPSYLSAHLRFGTISIRHVARLAWARGGRGAHTWLGELIWREFFFQLLYHSPKLAEGHSFKPQFDALAWPGKREHFAAWCAGQTGYPLVDAAMRQLEQTGYMHNRLRMVAASFLVKDLLVDWRLGEAWFARKLLDFDLAANNGGWQWAASTGCDAQPWFRIFNPVTQSKKFDPRGAFIRRYVPELAACDDDELHEPWKIPALRRHQLGLKYPEPIVDHAVQRARALKLYEEQTKAFSSKS